MKTKISKKAKQTILEILDTKKANELRYLGQEYASMRFYDDEYFKLEGEALEERNFHANEVEETLGRLGLLRSILEEINEKVG